MNESDKENKENSIAGKTKEIPLPGTENGDTAQTGEGDIKAPQKKPVKSILVVDDEEMIRTLFKDGLEKFGYEVTVAGDGDEGLRLFCKHPADLVITDVFMPKKGGITLILDIKKEFPGAHIFAMTGRTSFDPEMELDMARKLGATKTFQKPVKFSTLLDAIGELTV